MGGRCSGSPLGEGSAGQGWPQLVCGRHLVGAPGTVACDPVSWEKTFKADEKGHLGVCEMKSMKGVRALR